MILLGDIHGDFQTIVNFSRKNKSDDPKHLIQVGDFGAGFGIHFIDDMSYLNEQLRDANITLYVVRGNHDNPNFFNGEFEWSNIKLLKDYTVMSIEGKRILFVGGAISIDRLQRIEGITWWRDEVLNFNSELLETFEGIDVVVTHSAPNFVFPKSFNQLVMSFAAYDSNLLEDLTYERELLNQMYSILIKKNNIKDWFYGHFHRTMSETYQNTVFNLLGVQHFQTYE
jgi:predicted phosphodiesterase